VKVDRWGNITFLVVGTLIASASLRLVLHHQYTFLHQDWRTEPKEQISTFVLLLGGIWLFLVGLYGLIGKKRRKNVESE
jgi:LPXTG-motif cell wall-anchored protein